MHTLRPYQHRAIKEALGVMSQTDEPVLLLASVGAGKSLIIAEILRLLHRKNKRALCLVNNAELVRNNAQTLKNQGVECSIFCAGLKQRCIEHSIVFGTPQSVLNGIKRDHPISDIVFNLIIIDEAHMLSKTFLRILRHYKHLYPGMRVLGCTGTDYKYKGYSIVGDDCFFKHRVGNITTKYLIDADYLVRPVFEVTDLQLDFSDVKPQSTGLFAVSDLEAAIAKAPRLTESIIRYTIKIMNRQRRFGCFVFASSVRHAQECMSYLPEGEAALITSKTKQEERIKILDAARRGEIKYLVNVAVLTVGVDVPAYDTCLFVRPTESLVLLTQMLGRVLRKAPNKTEALILDCAGNLDRHRDFDDPILLDAIKQTEDANEIEKPFLCYICNTYNSVNARRCTGVVNKKRCEHYFTFKQCPGCNTKNDITAKYCRQCEKELINPNDKLSVVPFNHTSHKVLSMEYKIQKKSIIIYYRCVGGFRFVEVYTPTSIKARNVFYGKFVIPHIVDGKRYYRHLNNLQKIAQLLALARTPRELIVLDNIIKRKIF